MLLSFISAGVMFYKEYINYDISAIYYGTDTRIFSVFMGSAFYFLFKDRDLENEKQKLNTISYVCLGVIVVIVLSVDYLSKSNYYGFLFLISILGSFMTVTSLKTGFLDFENPVANTLAKLGEHSYVYYLWQYPLMIFSLEFFKWSDIDYNYTVGIQVIILIILSEISYEFLIKRRQESIVLRRIFLVLYVALLAFLPISSETNSEEVKNRANEIDKMAVVETTENTSKVEDKNQVEEETLATKVSATGHKELKTDSNKSSAKTNIKPEENKTVVKNTDTIEAKDYTFIGDSVMKMGEPYIKEIFKDANVDAKVSRQFTDLPKILEELKGSKKLRNTVVIHLGTNGVINKEAFESSMRMLKGKKVYINVWASWCGPCIREMPELEKAYQKLKDKEDVVFLSITSPSDDVFKNQSPQDKDKATILAKAQELGVTYPVLFDVNDRFLVNYTIRSFPTHIFINSDGTISNQISGALTESALEEEISKIK